MNLDVIQQLKKTYGNNVIKKASQLPDWVVLPIGIPELDYQMGGGVHVGHWNFFAGNKNVGKTSVAYQIIKQFQKLEVSCYYFDFDRFFSEERAKTFGVDTDNLVVISEQLTTEIVQKIGATIIESHNNSKDDKRCLIVLDSLAALASDKTYEKLETNKVGTGYGAEEAKANNTLLRVWNGLGTENTTFVVIQQYRDNFSMGEDNMLPGGRAQEYYASNIVELRAGQTLKDGTTPIGQMMKWTVKKTKNASPKQTGETIFNYKTGFDNYECLLRTAIDMEIIQQAGAFYTVMDERIRGKEALFEFLKEKPEFLEKLHAQVYSKMETKIWDGQEIKIKPDES